MPLKLNHVGHVVENLETAQQFYVEAFGMQPSRKGVRLIPEEGMKTIHLTIGNNSIELIEPTDFNKPAGRFLRDHGPGLYHVCLWVDDYENTYRKLREKGAWLQEVREGTIPVKRCWVAPSTTGGALLEFVQPKFDSGKG